MAVHHLNSAAPGGKLVQRVDVTYLAVGAEGIPAIDRISVFKDPGGIVPLAEKEWAGTPAETMIRAAVANALSSGHVAALRSTLDAHRQMLCYIVDEVLTDGQGGARLDADGNPMLSEAFLDAYKHLTQAVAPADSGD